MLLIGSPAAAAPDLSVAQGHVNAAAGHFRAGDFAAALGSLREAEPIAAAANDPSLAPIRFNIARCLEELGRDREALDAYTAYLRLPDQGHRKERAVKAIAALEGKIFGVVAVSCDPAGALVAIEGVLARPTPCPVRRSRVAPGAYRVRVSFDGYQPAERMIEVKVGQTAAATVRLEPVPPEGGITVPPMDAPPPAAPVDPWPWVAFGGAALAGGAGALMTVRAIDARDEAEGLPPGGGRDDAVSRFETSEALAWVGYGVAGAALITGIWWVLDDDEAPARAWAPTGTGLEVRW